MAQFANNFVVSGIVVADPTTHEFATSTVARFGLSIMQVEQNGNRVSAIQNCEAWRKKENAWTLRDLKKGAQVTISGYFRPNEWVDEKTNTRRNSVILSVTHIELTEKSTEQTQEEYNANKTKEMVAEVREAAAAVAAEAAAEEPAAVVANEELPF